MPQGAFLYDLQRCYYEVEQEEQKTNFVDYYYYCGSGDDHSDACLCVVFILTQIFGAGN